MIEFIDISAINVFVVLFIVLVILALVTLSKACYIVNQAEVIIIERFGKFHSVLRSGLHFIVPFADRPRMVFWTFVKEDARGKHLYRYSEYIERIDLREAVYDFPKQNVITKDNVTMEISALLYFQITDPQRVIYEVNNLPHAIEKLTQTTLRNIIGSLDLDETLTSRDQINHKLRIILDEATDKWGVKVNRVELQEVNPPADIKEAMEKQMRAERSRRAIILEAEGQKQSDILLAEGDKQSAILKAEGSKLAEIMRAEGDAQARTLYAEAEARALVTLKNAIPTGDPLAYLIAKDYIRMMPEMMKDKEGKMIVVPYEATALTGSLATIKELFKN
jgi:regulator of protease activity HflC (stomatin/prohibitin superfamily)